MHLLPRSVEEALSDSGLGKFNELVQLSGVGEEYFSNKTIFAPSNRALGDVPSEVLEAIKADPERLREFVSYHTAGPKTCKCDLDNNIMMKSGLEGKKHRCVVQGQMAR